MESPNDNSPQYLLEIFFDRFTPKEKEENPIFIKWKIGKNFNLKIYKMIRPK